jgi:hypothetical protein
LLFAESDFMASRDATASTFVDNMRLPVHRWCRYSAGFSAPWAEGTSEKLTYAHEILLDRSDATNQPPSAEYETDLLVYDVRAPDAGRFLSCVSPNAFMSWRGVAG